MARRKTPRQSAAGKGLDWLPRQKKKTSVGGVVLFVLLGLPLLAFGNLLLFSAVASTAIGQWQSLTGTAVHGVLTETETHTVTSRKGPDEHYCFAYFDSDDGRYVQHRVRVYADADDCSDLEGSPARLVRGAAQSLSAAVTSDRDGDLDDPMAFDGLYGMTDGASVGHSAAFLKGLWPFLFIAPITVVADIVVVEWIRSRFFPRRKSRRKRPGPGKQGTGTTTTSKPTGGVT